MASCQPTSHSLSNKCRFSVDWSPSSVHQPHSRRRPNSTCTFSVTPAPEAAQRHLPAHLSATVSCSLKTCLAQFPERHPRSHPSSHKCYMFVFCLFGLPIFCMKSTTLCVSPLISTVFSPFLRSYRLRPDLGQDLRSPL